MWVALAVICFLLVQLYLFRCLGKLDRFLESREHGTDQVILSVALSDPAMEAQMAQLLEAYCLEHPDVELVLHIDPAVAEAVRKKRADVGLCPDTNAGDGLNCLTLTLPGEAQRQLVWKNDQRAGAFVEYLWQACRK